MELREYWGILRRRWAVPVLLTALVALISGWQLRPWQAAPVTYSASMRMLVGVLPLAEADVTQYDPRYFAWLTSEYLVDDFTEVVGTELFARAINARLAQQGVAISPGLIRGSSNTGKQHRIIRLTFSWGDAEELRAIAAAAAAELEENAAAYFSQLGTDNASIQVLDSPTVVAQGQGVRGRIEWPLRVLLAAIAGVGLAFLLEYLDESVRRRTHLEELGLRVIGTIPRK